MKIRKSYKIANAVCNVAGKVMKPALLVALGAFGVQIIAAAVMDVTKKSKR